jgi:hypothetical protein
LAGVPEPDDVDDDPDPVDDDPESDDDDPEPDADFDPDAAAPVSDGFLPLAAVFSARLSVR